MSYEIDSKRIIKNYCQHATLKLCCAKEEESGRGIAVRGGLDENNPLVGAVPGPDFLLIVDNSGGVLSDLKQQFQQKSS